MLLSLWVLAKSLQSCPTLCDPMDCIACQASLSVGFPRQSYWSGVPCPPPGIFPTQRLNPHLLCLLHWHLCHLGSPLAVKARYPRSGCRSVGFFSGNLCSMASGDSQYSLACGHHSNLDPHRHLPCVFPWPSLVRTPVTLDQGPTLLHHVLALI